jgi:hypothetical protein
MPIANSRIWIAAQAAIVIAALAAMSLAPPVRGRMMIVSLNGQSAGAIAAWASRGDLRIIGIGPVAGSLVVDADAAGLARRAFGHGGVVLAAPSAECGRGIVA